MMAGRRPTGRGFTLIELMIAVAIVGILTAIAYPSYADSVRKSKRGHAKAALVELAQRAERYRTVQGSYAGFWATVPSSQRVSPRDGEGTAAYNLEFAANEANTGFTLSAVPQGAQTADTRCSTLTLDQAGQKSESGTGTVADCW
jgi:type IV pilus assembly protein PilE